MQILVGRDKGKQGIINQIIEECNWVYVEGLNCEYTKFGEKDNFPGIVVKEELPLLVRSVDWDFSLDNYRNEIHRLLEIT